MATKNEQEKCPKCQQIRWCKIDYNVITWDKVQIKVFICLGCDSTFHTYKQL